MRPPQTTRASGTARTSSRRAAQAIRPKSPLTSTAGVASLPDPMMPATDTPAAQPSTSQAAVRLTFEAW